MTIFRIVTKQGSVIDIHHVGVDFDFGTTCSQMRLNGYFHNENFHISYENVAFCAFGPELPTVQANAPFTVTKQ